MFTAVLKEKAKKPACPKNTPEAKDEENDFPEQDVKYASNTEPDNQEMENDISTADQSETPMEFSIGTPPKATAPVIAPNDYPYVPNSSFSFQMTTDRRRIIRKQTAKESLRMNRCKRR